MTRRVCWAPGCVEWSTHRVIAFDRIGHPLLLVGVCERCSDKVAQELIEREDVRRVAVVPQERAVV